MGYAASDLGGSQGAPTMFMCLAICTTCVCHLVIFLVRKVCLLTLLNYRSSRRQHFTCLLFDLVIKQLLGLHLLFS